MLANVLKSTVTKLVLQQRFNRCSRHIHCTPLAYKDGTQIKKNLYSFKMPCLSEEEIRHFDSIYPILVKDLVSSVKHSNIPNITDKYTKLLEYNIPNGKKRRGLISVLSYKLLENPEKLTPENLQLAGIMGWFMELIIASFLINDDLMDNSIVRRNMPAWHKVDGVSISAANDAVILENSVYLLLHKYFHKHPCYMHLVTMFHDVMWRSSVGQSMDYHCCYARGRTLDKITVDTYRGLVKYKGGYLMFYLPVAASMYLAGIQEDRLFQEAGVVLQELGYWAQVKNDFLDCFGDVSTNRANLYGDIREGKCAWPAVTALKRATPEQRAIMERCFGRPDDASVQAVMDVYRAVDIPTVYTTYHKEIFSNMHSLIDRIDSRIPKDVFYNVMELC